MTDAAEKKPRKPRAKKLDAAKAGEAAPTTPLLPPADIITIPRHGDEPVDFLAVMRALSTLGAVVPDTCPVIDTNPEQL